MSNVIKARKMNVDCYNEPVNRSCEKSYFSKQDTNRLGWLPDHKVNIAEDA